MTLLASVMLLASACTGKQASEKTASGLEPANFRTEVDGKQTDLLFWRIRMVWKFVLRISVDVLYQ
mgnify:FL=1